MARARRRSSTIPPAGGAPRASLTRRRCPPGASAPICPTYPRPWTRRVSRPWPPASARTSARIEARGTHCVVEPVRRGTLDYFFAYPRTTRSTVSNGWTASSGSANPEIFINYSQEWPYPNTTGPHSPVDYHFPRGNPEDHPSHLRTALHRASLTRPPPFSARRVVQRRPRPPAGDRGPGSQRRVTVAETRSTHA